MSPKAENTTAGSQHFPYVVRNFIGYMRRIDCILRVFITIGLEQHTSSHTHKLILNLPQVAYHTFCREYKDVEWIHGRCP